VPIDVVAPDPAWPARFAQVAGQLRSTLAAVPVRSIEHVGSTSVPGLWAKPILDIDVVVTADHVAAAIAALEVGGYVYLGEMGIADRHAFDAPDEPRRHVYVVVDGSLALRNHLAVRDTLRTDAVRRERYAVVKRSLGEALDPSEIDRYVEGKSAVIAEILSVAGLGADDLERIERANRAEQ
jgi:GrpB-like predicted nucleotidyltransferase (UPF0157 family)